ncbi:Uncharacterized protein FWK35_00035561, partial [Aphis craccivora]
MRVICTFENIQVKVVLRGVAPKLHQTAIGRAWAQHVIDNECNPTGIKAQILMIYDHVGMKASQMMYKYLSTGPLVLVLPNVMDDARRFKAAYKTLKAQRGEEAFPYTRLMGAGDGLNHARFPDLYYCAINYYKSIGAIGGKDGKFIKSSLETKTEASVLDKYCKISASGSGISEAHLTVWVANAAEVGGHVDEEDLKKVKRRLKRKHEDSDDEPNTIKIKVSKCYNEMKIQAKTTKTNPAHIFGECVAKLDDKSQMPPENIVKRTLRNQRTKNNPLDSDEIVDEWCTTGEPHNKRFLLFDD